MSHYPGKSALLALAEDIRTDLIDVEMEYHPQVHDAFCSVRDELMRLYQYVCAMDALLCVDQGEDEFLKAIGEINEQNKAG